MQVQILWEILPETLCRTFLCSVSDSHSDNNQSVTLPGRWGCFRVDCFSVCMRWRGVLSDLWGTRISNRTAILNIPINPWGWRRGWLLETHRLNRTTWWDCKLINKLPCTPCGKRNRGKLERSVWSYFCPFTWVTWPLTSLIHTGLFNFHFSVQLCSLLNDWVIKFEQERERESRLTSLLLQIFSCLFHFSFILFPFFF